MQLQNKSTIIFIYTYFSWVKSKHANIFKSFMTSKGVFSKIKFELALQTTCMEEGKHKLAVNLMGEDIMMCVFVCSDPH